MGITYLPIPHGRRNRGPLLLILLAITVFLLYTVPSPNSYRANRDVTVSIYPIDRTVEDTALHRQHDEISAHHAEAEEQALQEEENARIQASRQKHIDLDARLRVRDDKRRKFVKLRTQTTLEREKSDDPSAPRSLALVFGRKVADVHASQWTARVNNLTRVAEYIVDDTSATLHLDENHGREAIVYIKYIIEHYDNLTDITVFTHDHNIAWHNNVLLRQDLVHTINYLNLDHVFDVGFFNTRCESWPGCPNWITFNANKTVQEEHRDRALDTYNPSMWEELFPGEPTPEYLSNSCCSQFAVSKEAIRTVPKDFFERLYGWLRKNQFDMYTGRQLEYMWQYVFTGSEQMCPRSKDCYCKGYGLCFDDDAEVEEYNRARQDDDESWSGPDGVRWGLKASAQDTMKRLEASLPNKIGMDSKFSRFVPVREVKEQEPVKAAEDKKEKAEDAKEPDEKKADSKKEEDEKPEDTKKEDDKKGDEDKSEKSEKKTQDGKEEDTKKPEDDKEDKKKVDSEVEDGKLSSSDDKKGDDKEDAKKEDDKKSEDKKVDNKTPEDEKTEDKKEDGKKTDEKEADKKTEDKEADKKTDDKDSDTKTSQKDSDKKSDEKDSDKKTGDSDSDRKAEDNDSDKKSDDKDTAKKADDKDTTKKSDDKDTTKKADDKDTTKKADDKDTTKKADDKKTTVKDEDEKTGSRKSEAKDPEAKSDEDSKSEPPKSGEKKSEEDSEKASKESESKKDDTGRKSDDKDASEESRKASDKSKEGSTSDDKPSKDSKSEGKDKAKDSDSSKDSQSKTEATEDKKESKDESSKESTEKSEKESKDSTKEKPTEKDREP